MLLRKLVAALAPLLLCVLVCAAFRWLDGLAWAGGFFGFALKGLLLGAALALVLPLAGISARTNGLVLWLLLGAGLCLLTLVYQYLETVGAVHWPVLAGLVGINGQVVLVEGAVTGFLVATALLYRRK